MYAADPADDAANDHAERTATASRKAHLACYQSSPVIFPKVWILLALFAVIAHHYWKDVPVKSIVLAFAAVLFLSVADARRHSIEYSKGPSRRYSVVAVERGTLFTGYPVVTRKGLFYQRMGAREYVVGWWSYDNQVERLEVPGNALGPASVAGGDSVGFELVARGQSLGVCTHLNPHVFDHTSV
jgi:hypothetical protein